MANTLYFCMVLNKRDSLLSIPMSTLKHLHDCFPGLIHVDQDRRYRTLPSYWKSSDSAFRRHPRKVLRHGALSHIR